MTEAEAVEAISVRWRAAWEERQAGVPFALQNEAFTAEPLFATVMIGPTTPKQLTQGPVGSRLFEHRGTIKVMLFGPLDVGAQQLALLAGDVRYALASQSIAKVLAASGAPPENVTTYAASSTPGKQGKWYTLSLQIPFEYQERA